MIRKALLERQGLLAAIGGAGLIAAAALYAPFVHHGPILCLSHGLAGLPCPACGLTRAFCLITRGEWWSAAQYNLLAYPLFLACLAAPLCWLWSTFVRPLPLGRVMYSARIGWFVGGVTGAYHGARLLWWTIDGTLWTQYVQTSWTWRLIQRAFGG